MKWSWTWKSWDLLIVIGGLAVGFGVWLLPSFTQSQEIQELFAKQKELREKRERVEAVEAEIAAERERLGLVYMAPMSPAPAQPAPGTPAQ